MNEKINLAAKLAMLEHPYEPGIVGYLNDYKLQVVKVRGPFVWHKHDDTDDFFLVVSGHLTIHLRDRDVDLDHGEILWSQGASSTVPTRARRRRCCSSSQGILSIPATPGAR